MSPRQRAQASVIRLTAKLAMTYPRKGIWGKAPLARRSRYEAALREAELRVALYAKHRRRKLAKELEAGAGSHQEAKPHCRTSRHDRPS
jgi:hypothetical protein